MNDLTRIWAPGDFEMIQALCAEAEALQAAPAELAPVIDIFTREVL